MHSFLADGFSAERYAVSLQRSPLHAAVLLILQILQFLLCLVALSLSILCHGEDPFWSCLFEVLVVFVISLDTFYIL